MAVEHSSHFSTAKEISAKASFFFMYKLRLTNFERMLKWCWNPSELIICKWWGSEWFKIDPKWLRGSLIFIYEQFGIIQNLQISPIPKTSNWSWTFFAVSYNKPTLKGVDETHRDPRVNWKNLWWHKDHLDVSTHGYEQFSFSNDTLNQPALEKISLTFWLLASEINNIVNSRRAMIFICCMVAFKINTSLLVVLTNKYKSW